MINEIFSAWVVAKVLGNISQNSNKSIVTIIVAIVTTVPCS